MISLVGGSKGLLVNNTNLCKQTNRASVLLDGQNSKIADSTPKVGGQVPEGAQRTTNTTNGSTAGITLATPGVRPHRFAHNLSLTPHRA